jgi:alpha/beta superfamily hydrolase
VRLARAALQFRGVGASQGAYDEGRGELQDMLAAIEQQAPADAPLAIAGFSFGAFVASHAVAALQGRRPIERVVLVGTAASASRWRPCRRNPRRHPGHPRRARRHRAAGRRARLGAPAEPAGHRGARRRHFFHGQLPLLKSLVARHVRA